MELAEQIETGLRGTKPGTSGSAVEAIRAHWPEYLMEGSLLGLFMISACSITLVLEHPASAVRQAVASPAVRRAMTGVAMGMTAIALIHSPWGKRSGAHFNPATTFTFFRIGKVAPWDALFYGLAQFAGGTLGVLASAELLGKGLMQDAVHYAATLPGPRGSGVAFAAELLISFLMMTMVLHVSNHPRLARFTGLCAGALVATFITLEAPLSGMSMNPARSFASAAPAGLWNTLWIYFTAPPLGMLLASEAYLRRRGKHAVICAKLHHHNHQPCIFQCGYKTLSHSTFRLEEAK